MTRKDFNAIAAAFKQSQADIDHPTSILVTDEEKLDAHLGLGIAVGRVADVLAASNPNFDRARFFKAALS